MIDFRVPVETLSKLDDGFSKRPQGPPTISYPLYSFITSWGMGQNIQSIQSHLRKTWFHDFIFGAPIAPPPPRLPGDLRSKDYDLLLTTYEMVRNDREKFADAQTICFSGGLEKEVCRVLYLSFVRLSI
jgi:hypothetical protein